MGGRDAANSSHNSTTGPGPPATVQTVFDAGRRDDVPQITGTRGPIASTPAVVDGTVFLPGGAVDAEEGKIEWIADVTSSASPPAATPAIAHGHAFHTGVEATVAVEIESGETRWSIDVGSPEVSPVVDGDRFYLPSERRSVGLAAIDVADGARSWTVGPSMGRFTGIAVDDELVYATETDDSDSGDGLVRAIDPDRGEETWSESVGRALVGPVATGDGVLVGTESGRLYSFGRDGALRWDRDAVSSHQGFVTSAPAVDDRRVYVPSNNGSVTTALDRESGDAIWEVETGMSYAAPAVGEERVYVGSNDGIHAVAKDTGELEGLIDGPVVRSGTAVVDDRLYFVSGTVVYAVR